MISENALQFIGPISHVLQLNDTSLYQSASALLECARSNNPNELVSAYMQILLIHSRCSYRKFCAQQLQTFFSNPSRIYYLQVWPFLRSALQKEIKLKLVLAASKEQLPQIKDIVKATIVSISDMNLQISSDSQFSFDMNFGSIMNEVESSFLITFSKILRFSPIYFEEMEDSIFCFFKLCLQHTNNQFKILALHCLSDYLQAIPTCYYSFFQTLIPVIFKNILILNEFSTNLDYLQILSTMILCHHVFFKRESYDLMQAVIHILGVLTFSDEHRLRIIHIFVKLCLVFSFEFNQNEQKLKLIITSIFYILQKIICKEIHNLQQQSLILKDKSQLQKIQQSAAIFKSLINIFDRQIIFPIIVTLCLPNLINKQDQKYPYFTLILISKLGEYVKIDKQLPIMRNILCLMNHQNCKIRQAACYSMEQIMKWRYYKPHRIESGILLTYLVSKLQNDSSINVAFHAASAINIVVEILLLDQLTPHANILMNLMLYHAEHSVYLMKNAALEVIYTVASKLKKNFQPYLQNSLEIMFKYFEAGSEGGKEAKLLKENALEIIIFISKSVGSQLFRDQLFAFTSILINAQRTWRDENDFKKSIIFKMWQKLAKLYGEQMNEYLQGIFLSLLSFSTNILSSPTHNFLYHEINIINKQQISNTIKQEQDNLKAVLFMLEMFAKKLKQFIKLYAKEIAMLLFGIMRNKLNSKVQIQACDFLETLIRLQSKDSLPQAVSFTKDLISIMLQTIGADNRIQNLSLIEIQLETVANLLLKLNHCFLTQRQVNSISDKIIQFAIKNYSQIKEYKVNSHDKDKDEGTQKRKKKKQEQLIIVNAADVIGALLKTHKNESASLPNRIISIVFPSIFEQQNGAIEFGIFLLDELIANIDIDVIAQDGQYFSEIYLYYMPTSNCILRHASAFGLGLLAEKIPNILLYKQNVFVWLDALFYVYNFSSITDDRSADESCRDNITAAIGKIIRQTSSQFDLSNYVLMWMDKLPLRRDKAEAIIQHQLFVDIILSEPSFLLQYDEQYRLKMIIRILKEIARQKKYYNRVIALKMKEYLTRLKINPFLRRAAIEIEQYIDASKLII